MRHKKMEAIVSNFLDFLEWVEQYVWVFGFVFIAISFAIKRSGFAYVPRWVNRNVLLFDLAFCFSLAVTWYRTRDRLTGIMAIMWVFFILLDLAELSWPIPS